MSPQPTACASSLTAAANVRRLREELGWSLHRLAREAGVAPGMVSLLEAGRRNFTLPTLERFGKALRTGARDLLLAVPGPPDGGG